MSIPKEESASPVPGDKPLWLDVSEDQLREALEHSRALTLHDKKNDLTLLYDLTLPDHLIRALDQLSKPRREGGFGWRRVVPWESFIGGECDTVVYVGSGSLEAFSRARLKLIIITISPDQSLSNYWRYNDALKAAEEKDLLEVKLLETVTPTSPLLPPSSDKEDYGTTEPQLNPLSRGAEIMDMEASTQSNTSNR